MARKLTAGERKHLSERAIRLSISGWTNQRIAEKLNLNPRTVARLLGELKEELVPDAGVALSETIKTYREVEAACWQQIRASGRELASGGFVPLMSPHALAALANTIINAEREIARLRGVEPADKLDINIHQESVAELAKRTAGIDPKDRLRLVDEEYLSETDG